MKFYGPVGYSIEIEKTYTDEVSGEVFKTGVFEPSVIERNYSGDILRNKAKKISGSGANRDQTVSNSISIIADPFAYENFMNIEYVTWMNTRWSVSDVDASTYPRIILEIGGVYNGPKKTATS